MEAADTCLVYKSVGSICIQNSILVKYKQIKQQLTHQTAAVFTKSQDSCNV